MLEERFETFLCSFLTSAHVRGFQIDMLCCCTSRLRPAHAFLIIFAGNGRLVIQPDARIREFEFLRDAARYAGSWSWDDGRGRCWRLE